MREALLSYDPYDPIVLDQVRRGLSRGGVIWVEVLYRKLLQVTVGFSRASAQMTPEGLCEWNPCGRGWSTHRSPSTLL